MYQNLGDAPPLGPGMPFLDSDTCTCITSVMGLSDAKSGQECVTYWHEHPGKTPQMGGYLFLPGFSSLYDAIHGQDGWMEKASRKMTTTSFTICNILM